VRARRIGKPALTALPISSPSPNSHDDRLVAGRAQAAVYSELAGCPGVEQRPLLAVIGAVWQIVAGCPYDPLASVL
jgi:hypothetical protein